MGPITLFDKSFLQSLSLDESVWFDHYFYSNICPLFYVETLADLAKTSLRDNRTGEEEVAIIAEKTPEVSGGSCTHHQELCIANLMGHRLPFNGQIPVAGGRQVQSANGKHGVVFESSPEALAFSRWQKGKFHDVERESARGWRAMLTNLDLVATAINMRKLGINPQTCKSLEQAHSIASEIVKSRNKPFDQMTLLFDFVDIPQDMHVPIIKRWNLDRNRPLAEYAPYAAHVLCVEIFFQIALGANLIPSERASNRVDIGYLFYLPFCTLFTSSDKLHKKCAPLFMRPNQEFVWGIDLKAELKRVNNYFSQLPENERDLGVLRLSKSPVGDNDSLMIQIWDRHLPSWRKSNVIHDMPNKESEKDIVQYLQGFNELSSNYIASPNTETDTDTFNPENLSINRMVRKKKGNWYQLPKDLQINEKT